MSEVDHAIGFEIALYLQRLGRRGCADRRTAHRQQPRRAEPNHASIRGQSRVELFIAARFNKVEGQLAGIADDVGANRWQLGAGMFLTPMIMAKLEYVTQEFTGYPVNHIRHGGTFKGLMLEGVVGF
jgi:hypothetical protein